MALRQVHRMAEMHIDWKIQRLDEGEVQDPRFAECVLETFGTPTSLVAVGPTGKTTNGTTVKTGRSHSKCESFLICSERSALATQCHGQMSNWRKPRHGTRRGYQNTTYQFHSIPAKTPRPSPGRKLRDRFSGSTPALATTPVVAA